MKKIIAGLVVIVAAAGIIKVVSTNDKKPVEQEEIAQVENGDVSDHLYEDTLTDEDEAINEDNDSEIEAEIETETQIDAENNSDNSNTTSSDTVNSEKEEGATSGEYQGFADGNFVEIKVGDTYNVYKVSDDIKSKLNSKNVGQTITFRYVESGGQRIITSVN